jgi:hypothetical protein
MEGGHRTAITVRPLCVIREPWLTRGSTLKQVQFVEEPYVS